MRESLGASYSSLDRSMDATAGRDEIDS